MSYSKYFRSLVGGTALGVLAACTHAPEVSTPREEFQAKNDLSGYLDWTTAEVENHKIPTINYDACGLYAQAVQQTPHSGRNATAGGAVGAAGAGLLTGNWLWAVIGGVGGAATTIAASDALSSGAIQDYDWDCKAQGIANNLLGGSTRGTQQSLKRGGIYGGLVTRPSW